MTLEGKQALTDDKNDMQLEVMDESEKSPDFFRDNKSNKPERKYTTIRINQEIFYGTFHMLE